MLIKRLSTTKKNYFYIFLKKKHKVIDLIATFKVLDNKTYVKINYKKLFKIYKKIKLKTTTFDNLLKLY